MKRAFAMAALAMLLAGCSMLDKVNPFATSPTKAKVAELEPIQPTASLVQQWQASVGAAADFVFKPAVVDASVYVAARDGTLARFDDGQEVWRIKAAQKLSGGVGSDGRLVVVGTSGGEVLAFDASGKAVWSTRVTSEVLAPAAVVGDLVVVRSGDNRIFGLDAADGKRRWLYQRTTPPLTLRSSVGVTPAANAVLAGFPGGKLVAVSLGNGAAVWEVSVAIPRGATELERVADVVSPPVMVDRTVCAVAYQGRLSCFDAGSGNTLWARDLPSGAGIATDGRNLYLTDDRGAVHALELASGASIWRTDKLANRGVTRPLALDGYVAVADSLGVVHLLRREDGAFAARFNTDGSAVVGELVRSRAGFIVQTANGGVYALALR